MRYSKNTHGRTSRENPATDSLREEWRMADGLNAHGGDGEWVPRETVYVRDDISPRTNANTDGGKVQEYAAVFRQLPPILVQKDTFVLIDGKHRLSAAFQSEASTLHIRIKEVDVPDDELREAAFRANAEHGRALTTAERVAFLKYLLLEKKDDRPDAQLAETVGLSRSTVMDYRHKWMGRKNEYPTGRANNKSSREPEMSESYISKEPLRKPLTAPAKNPVSSSEPDPEPVYEGEGRDDVDKETGELIDTGAGSDGTPAVAPPPARIPNFLGLGPAAADYLAHLRAAASTADEIVAEVAANRPASSEARLYLSALADHLASLAVTA